MKNKFWLSLVLAVVLTLALAGGAFAGQRAGGQNNFQWDYNWEKGSSRVGLLQAAGTPGYDFVLINGENYRVLLVPANAEAAAKLAASLNKRVMVRGKYLPEKFHRGRAMEVSDVRELNQWQFVERLRDQTGDDDDSVSENVYGNQGQPSGQEPGDFSDIGPGHWAAKAIREMAKRKVITGMGNNEFAPNAQVTRAQFATMLVKALGLPVTDPATRTFADVGPQEWCYKYVEAAKDYLTGYKTQAGTLLFHPSIPAVREDMAVAIVKARGLSPATDLSVLNSFSDKDSISEQIKPYVAAAVNAGLMKGYDNGTFRPQGKLTRAEAAALLYKVMIGEKVVM